MKVRTCVCVCVYLVVYGAWAALVWSCLCIYFYPLFPSVIYSLPLSRYHWATNQCVCVSACLCIYMVLIYRAWGILVWFCFHVYICPVFSFSCTFFAIMCYHLFLKFRWIDMLVEKLNVPDHFSRIWSVKAFYGNAIYFIYLFIYFILFYFILFIYLFILFYFILFYFFFFFFFLSFQGEKNSITIFCFEEHSVWVMCV